MKVLVTLTAVAALTAPTPAAAVDRRVEGHGVEWWHEHAVANRRTINRLRRIVLHRRDVSEAINLACTVYGHCGELWRKARCETGGTFSPRSLNSASRAAGLFQFLPSTWATTPFGRFSVWSPYANALAAGWMHTQGRGSEWACR